MLFSDPVRSLAIASLAFSSLFSCQEQQDKKGVLAPERMAEVLYDYQLAQSYISQTENNDPSKLLQYRLAVFHKHQIREEDFNQSLAYYSRHTKEMKEVYTLLQQRYEGEKGMKLLTSSSEGAKQDTLDVWQKSLILLSARLRNQQTMTISLPKQMKEGDRLLLSFSSRWHYRQGSQQAWIALQLQMQNDSTAVSSTQIAPYLNRQTIEYPLSAQIPKQIQLHIFQLAPWNPYPQLLEVSHLHLAIVRTSKDFKSAAPSKSTSSTTTPRREDEAKQLKMERSHR